MAYYSANQFPANLYGSPTGVFNAADNMMQQIQSRVGSTPPAPIFNSGTYDSSYNYNYGYNYGYNYIPGAVNDLYGGAFMVAQGLGGGLSAAKTNAQTSADAEELRIKAMQQQSDYASQTAAQQNMMASFKNIIMMKMFMSNLNNMDEA